MNAADHIGELTALLVRIGASAQPVEPSRTGVDAALHGRGAVLAMSQQVLHDVLRRQTLRHPTIGDLQTRPMAVLAWAVDHHPALSGSQSPIDVARTVAPGSMASLWEQAGACATRAHVHWALSDARLTGGAGRAAVTDIAVVALALTRLEDGLAASAQQLGDPVVIDRLASRHASGLRVAAEMTLRQSASQELPTWEARPRLDTRHLGVHVVRDAVALPHGLHRLNQLLHAGTPMSPGNIATLLTAQVRMSALLSQRAARASGDPGVQGLAVRLAEHGRALTGAWDRSDNSLASLEPPDPRALQQAGECQRALRGAGRSPMPFGLLRQSAALLLNTACATSASVEQQVRAGRWISSHTPEDSRQVGRQWSVVSSHLPPNVMAALAKVSSAIRAQELQGAPMPSRATVQMTSALRQQSPQPARLGTPAPTRTQAVRR